MSVLDILFPPSCVGCGKHCGYLCRDCWQDIRWFSFGVCPVCDRPTSNYRTHAICGSSEQLDGQVVLADYKDPVRQLITSVKYEGVWDTTRVIPAMLKQHWPTILPPFDVLVPIPLHPQRQQERGFNQAEKIARSMQPVLHVPLAPRCLHRVRPTAHQAGKDLQERLKLPQPFQCRQPHLIQNKRVAIVDDVITTGATMARACQALRAAGAKEIWGIALAHPY